MVNVSCIYLIVDDEDADDDGIPNDVDTDDDNDGIPDDVDTDDDNDGIPDDACPEKHANATIANQTDLPASSIGSLLMTPERFFLPVQVPVTAAVVKQVEAAEAVAVTVVVVCSAEFRVQ
eukprot:maker-scaffold754_size102093-snap-gene-0.11 protein:Tk00385 transcript:maker-scaffold754_size102093-snap-gene-0.11-mRNA-1 annotation:"hypothetical protein"